MFITSKGQSLIELIIVIALTVLIVGALTFATIASLRNADLANSQIQATKLAQEGLEKVKIIRDRNTSGDVFYDDDTTNENHIHTIFSDFWAITFSCEGAERNCDFMFDSGVLRQAGSNSAEHIPDSIFYRQIQIAGEGNTNQKTITSIVKWSDFSGEHQSVLTTILGRI